MLKKYYRSGYLGEIKKSESSVLRDRIGFDIQHPLVILSILIDPLIATIHHHERGFAATRIIRIHLNWVTIRIRVEGARSRVEGRGSIVIEINMCPSILGTGRSTPLDKKGRNVFTFKIFRSDLKDGRLEKRRGRNRRPSSLD